MEIRYRTMAMTEAKSFRLTEKRWLVRTAQYGRVFHFRSRRRRVGRVSPLQQFEWSGDSPAIWVASRNHPSQYVYWDGFCIPEIPYIKEAFL